MFNMKESDVKDMFVNFARFDRNYSLNDMSDYLTEYFMDTEEYAFAKIMANSVTHNYSKLGSVTAVYREYITDENITDALVSLVYDTVYKEKIQEIQYLRK